jgi:hypothetical protein
MQMCVEGACQEEEELSHYHVVHRMPLPHESLQQSHLANTTHHILDRFLAHALNIFTPFPQFPFPHLQFFQRINPTIDEHREIGLLHDVDMTLRVHVRVMALPQSPLQTSTSLKLSVDVVAVFLLVFRVKLW